MFLRKNTTALQVKVVRQEGEKRMLQSLVFHHPQRNQRVQIVPVPRVGQTTYYDEQVYQPFARDNTLIVGVDIFSNFYAAIPRIVVRVFKLFPGYGHFTLIKLPDGIDMSISRQEHHKRHLNLQTPVLRWLFTPVAFRDWSHPWVAKNIKKTVGLRFKGQEKEETKSNFVYLLPPAQCVTAASTLHDLGFRITQQMDHSCGDEKQIRGLETYAVVGEFFCLCYVWTLKVATLFAAYKFAKETGEREKERIMAEKMEAESAV